MRHFRYFGSTALAGAVGMGGAAMVLVGILVLGQVADGLTYTLAHNGVELNPLMAALGGSAVAVKFAAAPFVGYLAFRLRGRPTILLWLGAVGWFGALSNFSGFG